MAEPSAGAIGAWAGVAGSPNVFSGLIPIVRGWVPRNSQARSMK
jgi:hypothetical protein